MLPYKHYRGVNRDDPIRFYYWPIIGALYRRRVELCLAECKGGERVLEVGSGSGVTFLNLHQLYREIHGVDLTASVEQVRATFQAMNIDVHLRKGNILQIPEPGGFFDTVLLISILEHLKPGQQLPAFQEVRRVLKPGGQVVYGVPIDRPFMSFMFTLVGYANIHDYHLSTEEDVREAARQVFRQERIIAMKPYGGILGAVYEIGHFVKA